MAIVKRVGFVIFTVIVFAIVGTVAALVFGLVKGMGSSDGAAIVGIGWFGALGGIVGPLMGREAMKEKSGGSSRAADAAGWIVGVIAALVCLSVAIAG